MFSISKFQQSIPEYSIRRSTRAKNTRIVVKADGRVEVVAPPQIAESRIRQFIQQQRDWVIRTQQRMQAKQAQISPPLSRSYLDGGTVPYLGQSVPLHWSETPSKTLRVVFRDQAFYVAIPQSLATDERCERVRLALVGWMKQQARERAWALLERYAANAGLKARSLTLKTMKSRWGSCGPLNDINLNWLLILGPEIVLEYVVVHEICHIRHKNHSAAFWELVAQIMPDYLQHRRWLKQHGHLLMQGL